MAGGSFFNNIYYKNNIVNINFKSYQYRSQLPGSKDTRCMIVIKFKNIVIFNLHLSIKTKNRMECATYFAKEIKKYTTEPTDKIIVVGDFNQNEKSKELKIIKKSKNLDFAIGSKNLEATSIYGKTVDHILISDNIHNYNADVYYTNTSDHFPLIIDLDLS